MKFAEIPYTRPDLDAFAADAAATSARFEAATTFDEQWQALLSFGELRKAVNGAAEVAAIRHTIDTTDAFYAAEQEFFDENRPRLEELNNRLYALLLASPHRAAFTERLGEQFFDRIALAQKVFSPEIMGDLAVENKLITAYDKLLGGAQVTFRGETYTLAGLGKFVEDTDRATRAEAQAALWGFFADNAAELDRLYDELVAVRHTMARKLGYENFVQMGYDRMGRTTYGPAEVERFRAGVLEHVVPLAAAGFEEQRQRLGLDRLTFVDQPVKFASGNPKPQGEEAWLRDRAREMYDELAPETSEFFRVMLERDHLDLTQKKGKQPGGYCTFIETADLPFIFSNFNGTSGDVDVLTHEFGHALQAYSSRHHPLEEQRWPTSEAAEVHSMSMEYLTYPWMSSFFGPDADKYHYLHQTGAVAFIPYGSLVDAFQHWVYTNPSASPDERKAEWRRLEMQYTPWVDYDGNEFLEAGGRWQKQGHLYWQAFYYIDYCLAQFVAMQVFLRADEDREAMWRDYLAMCRVGGSVDFLSMLGVGHVESPFDPAVVGRTLGGIAADIATIDVASLR